MDRFRNFINGEFRDPTTGEWLDVYEPATGRVYAQVANSGSADIDAAVRAAREAFPGWAATAPTERSRLLLRLADLIERDLDQLAVAESEDNGKPVSLARSVDIPRAATNLRFFATAILHEAHELFRTHTETAQAINYTLRAPRGVAGCISPWNLPLYLFTWKVAPALASGNTVVGKPSEITPRTATVLGELAAEAGLPPGVLNVVHGSGATAGHSLVMHPDVPAISFTGGTATGAKLAAGAGPMFKRLSLELGGKNPTIVFADCDYEATLAEAVRAAFANQGQICLCGSRILVEAPLYERFVADFVDRVRAIRVGDPNDASTQHGALVSHEQLEKVRYYVGLAQEEGGDVLCGGQPPAELPERCRDGYFFRPTVIAGLDGSCRTNMEEIFGPVVTVQPFADEAEAVRLANGTPYGLAASVWTTNLGRAHRVSAVLDYGIVWVNCWMLRDLRTPFGGAKQSGVGREGGAEALHFFTEPKTVCIRTDA